MAFCISLIWKLMRCLNLFIILSCSSHLKSNADFFGQWNNLMLCGLDPCFECRNVHSMKFNHAGQCAETLFIQGS